MFYSKYLANFDKHVYYKDIQLLARNKLKILLKDHQKYVFVFENKKKKGKRGLLSFNMMFRPKIKCSNHEKVRNNNLEIGRKTLMICIHFNFDQQGQIDMASEKPVSFRIILGSKISSYLPEITAGFIENKQRLINLLLNGDYERFTLECLEISNGVFLNYN